MSEIELVIKAIRKINPNAQNRIVGETLKDCTIEWIVGDPISKSDIEAKMNEMANEPEQSNYAQQRKNAYPPVGDQLDMLWHTIDKDEKLQGKYFDFYQTLKTVKVKFPKK